MEFSTDPKIVQLRQEAEAARLKAERLWYAYFGECEVGPERIRASEVYENIRCATRRGF